MHLAGLAPGFVAPARLRASGAASLAAQGGHSLGEGRGRGGEREVKEKGKHIRYFLKLVFGFRNAEGKRSGGGVRMGDKEPQDHETSPYPQLATSELSKSEAS